MRQGQAAASLIIADKWRRTYGPDDEWRSENDLELFLNCIAIPDPAFWPEWVDTVLGIIGGDATDRYDVRLADSVRLTEQTAFESVIRYLERYYIRGKGNDVGIGELMREMQSASILDSDLWQRWLGYVDRASRESPDKLIREWLDEFK